MASDSTGLLLPRLVDSKATLLEEWEDWWFAAVEDGLINTLSHVRSYLPFPNGVDHRSVSGHSATNADRVKVATYRRLQGETALHCAIRLGKHAVARWLVEHAGANPMLAYEVLQPLYPGVHDMDT